MGTYFDHIENELLEQERRVIELVEAHTKTKENLETLVEKKLVFDKSTELIATSRQLQEVDNIQHGMEEGHHQQISFIAGVIKADDDLKMKRMIFRISKGKAMATYFDFNNNYLDVPNDTKAVSKKIFTIILPTGGPENILLSKVLKICDLFNASRFNVPSRENIKTQVENLQKEINEQREYMKEAELTIKNFLKEKFGDVF